MGLKPGDEFEIKLGYKHIRLVKMGDSSEQSSADVNEEDSE
ncbi:MAG TPA: AbrB-like transcriptional regulator [Oculatellaceae cyanobacterium]